MSTLYIRSPSTAAVSDAHAWLALPWSYAIAAGDDVTTQGSLPLIALRDKLLQARRTVILLAASDVTLLRVAVPPLSAARLKQALPHLVEDQLMADPSDCVLVAGEATDGLRTIAVMQRAWLETLAAALRGIGAKDVIAIPSQMCLPVSSDRIHAAATGYGAVDLAVRLSQHAALGFPILSVQPDATASEVMQTLQALAPDGELVLRIAPPGADVHAEDDAASQSALRCPYRTALNVHPDLADRITLVDDRWQDWIADSKTVTLNLFAGLDTDLQRDLIDWRRWRWPLALAASVMLVNALGLNLQWWHLKSEAQRLRSAMADTYRSAYPQEKVIVDPLLQMQQKIAAAKRLSGEVAADDFIALAAAFGEAWRSVAPSMNNVKNAHAGSPFISIEYRERALLVKPKSDSGESVGKLRSALAARNLTLSQPNADAWQIRMAK